MLVPRSHRSLEWSLPSPLFGTCEWCSLREDLIAVRGTTMRGTAERETCERCPVVQLSVVERCDVEL